MSARCSYRRPDDSVCKRWASDGSRFCYRHGPAYNLTNRSEGDRLHPLARLTTPEDILDVVRETLNATRLGRISPGQAYAVGYLVDIWLRVYYKLEPRQRDTALYRQLLPELIEHEHHAAKKLAHAHPLPTTPSPPAPTGAPPEPTGKSTPEHPDAPKLPKRRHTALRQLA